MDPLTPLPEQKKRRYEPHHYMLCVIHEPGYRRIFSPDFDFHFTVPTGDNPQRWTAMTLDQAETEIACRLLRLSESGKPHPTPKKWRNEVISSSQKTLSIQEASKILGVSESTVRRLAKDGTLPYSQTRRGHRRFSMQEIQEYLYRMAPLQHP